MSAVIAITERHAAIRDAINARARSSGATEAQRQAAMTAALRAYHDGSSAGAAIALGQSKMPSPRVYRSSFGPGSAA